MLATTINYFNKQKFALIKSRYNTQKLLIGLALALISIVSCDKNLPTNNPDENPQSDTFLSFSTTQTCSAKALTRGSIIDSTNIDKIGVLAYFLPEAGGVAQTALPDTATPYFMYNQLVHRTKSADKWSSWKYTPIKRWTDNPNDRILFFAYTPYNGDGITLSSANTQGYPTITYTANRSDITQQPDLAVAQRGPLYWELVSLKFKHILSKISFSIAGNTGVAIKEVRIENILNKGTYSYENDIWTSDPTSIGAFTADTEMLSAENMPQIITKSDTYLFMVPQKVAAGTRFIITIDDTGTEISDTLTLSADQDWEAGKSYTYLLNMFEGTIVTTEEIVNKYWDGGKGHGYPPGDTWVFKNVVNTEDWYKIKWVINKAVDSTNVKLNIVFPNLKSMGGGNSTLYQSGITSFSAPVLESIPSTFLQGCTNLESINLPNVTKIGYNAFYGCTSLTKMELATNPNTVLTDVASEIYEWNKVTVDLIIGSDNAHHISTKRIQNVDHPSLVVSPSTANNPFKSITQKPN